MVAAGHDHTCVLYSFKRYFKCYGSNAHGQLDIPSLIHNDDNESIVNYDYASMVAAGQSYTCLIYSKSSLLICFGVRTLNHPTPTNLPLPSVISVSLGAHHGCYVTKSNKVLSMVNNNYLLCWGYNEHGQTDIPRGYEFNTYQIELGYTFSCGVYSNKILCWGGNSKGQLMYPTKVIYQPNKYAYIAVGDFHVCAYNNKDIVCWGDKEHGLIKNIPQVVSDEDIRHIRGVDNKNMTGNTNNDNLMYDDVLVSLEHLSGGFSNNCGIFFTLNHTTKVVCWGKSDKGQLQVPDLEHEDKVHMMKGDQDMMYGNDKTGIYKRDNEGLYNQNIKYKIDQLNYACKVYKTTIKKVVYVVCFSLVGVKVGLSQKNKYSQIAKINLPNYINNNSVVPENYLIFSNLEKINITKYDDWFYDILLLDIKYNSYENIKSNVEHITKFKYDTFDCSSGKLKLNELKTTTKYCLNKKIILTTHLVAFRYLNTLIKYKNKYDNYQKSCIKINKYLTGDDKFNCINVPKHFIIQSKAYSHNVIDNCISISFLIENYYKDSYDKYYSLDLFNKCLNYAIERSYINYNMKKVDKDVCDKFGLKFNKGYCFIMNKWFKNPFKNSYIDKRFDWMVQDDYIDYKFDMNLRKLFDYLRQEKNIIWLIDE